MTLKQITEKIEKIYVFKENFESSETIKQIDVSKTRFIESILQPNGGWGGNIKADEIFWGNALYNKHMSDLKNKPLEKDEFLTAILALHFTNFPKTTIKSTKQKEKVALQIIKNRGYSFLYVVYAILHLNLDNDLGLFKIFKYNNHHVTPFNAYELISKKL